MASLTIHNLFIGKGSLQLPMKPAKAEINGETTIGEAIQLNAKAAEILLAEGLHCLNCCGAMHETIHDGLAMHGKSEEEINEIIKKLNKNR